jgi:hypothetical protein
LDNLQFGKLSQTVNFSKGTDMKRVSLLFAAIAALLSATSYASAATVTDHAMKPQVAVTSSGVIGSPANDIAASGHHFGSQIVGGISFGAGVPQLS